MTGGLGSPDGCNGVQDACAHAIEDTGAEHPVGVLGRALQCGANDSPHGGQCDGIDSSELVTKPATDERTDESAGEIIDRDLADRSAHHVRAGKGRWKVDRTYDTALQQRVGHIDLVLLGIPVPKAHGSCIVAIGIHTSHDPLVVAEEEDGQACHGIDQEEKACLLIAAGDVELGDAPWGRDDAHDGGIAWLFTWPDGRKICVVLWRRG